MPEEIPYKNYPILFVDDEELALSTFRRLFQNDFTIYTAENGEEALEIMKAHPEIVMVVTDQRMPRMNGTELLTRLVHQFPAMINIIVTAYSDPSLIIEAINRGNLYRFLTKPYDREILKQYIIQGLKQYHWVNRFYAEKMNSIEGANKTNNQSPSPDEKRK